jgi:predicted MFS family arabinose efflux permease
VVFLAHQIGAFLGAWYGGYIFDLIGSYLPVWIITIALGVLAAILCLPINERPIGRLMQKGTAA